MEHNYWESITKTRWARRRLLKTGAALSLGAVAVAAVGCSGDDDDDGNGGSGGEGEPKQGGRLGRTGTWGASNYNPLINAAETYLAGMHVYDRLISGRTDERQFVLEAAASVEQPQPNQVVAKLRPGMVY